MNTTKITAIALGLLLGVSVIIGGMTYSKNSSQISELQSKVQELGAEKASLEKDKSSLEQENATLRETPDFYYKHAVELQSSGDLSGAKDAFEAVASKFPTSPLVGHAQLQVGLLNTLIAKAEADAEAEEARKQAEQEAVNREQGEPISFDDLYARAKSTGLPIGKRFRFFADLDEIYLYEVGDTRKMLSSEPAYDNEVQHQALLKGHDNKRNRTVVASMGSDGEMQVHKVE